MSRTTSIAPLFACILLCLFVLGCDTAKVRYIVDNQSDTPVTLQAPNSGSALTTSLVIAPHTKAVALGPVFGLTRPLHVIFCDGRTRKTLEDKVLSKEQVERMVDNSSDVTIPFP
jgi:hypothetical protein